MLLTPGASPHSAPDPLEALLSDLSEAVLVVDGQGLIRFANPAAGRLLQLPCDQIPGRPFRQPDGGEAADGTGLLDGMLNPSLEVRFTPVTWNGQSAHLAHLAPSPEATVLSMEAETLLRCLTDTLENISDGFLSIEEDWTVGYFNRAAELLLARDRSEVVGRSLFDAFPQLCDSIFQSTFEEAMRARRPTTLETFFDRKPYVNWYEIRVFPRPTGISVYLRVLTRRKEVEAEQRRLEARVQQTQKLESLGVLAGGIAHDFNNLLMGILGHADLALLELSPVSPARENLEQIVIAARHAADLTRQMLAYAGRGNLFLRPLNLSSLIGEMFHLLQVSVGKKSVLKYHLKDDLPLVKGDPAQLRQVVLSLAVNAGEAIGERSGVISLSTGVMDCDRRYLAETYLDDDLSEGRYVFLEVADNGCGMEAELRGRIFEPFFSTKFTGRGLGLAAALGIVRSLAGAIKVYSEPGQGTTVKMLLPALDAAGLPVESEEPQPPWRGRGTVLVVDDEEAVRRVAVRMLQQLGFQALAAADGRQAVELYRRNADKIVLVLLDMTMPHLSGEETFRELRRIRREVRVLLSSGYSREDTRGGCITRPG